MSLTFEKVREIVANPEELFENAFNEWYFGKHIFDSSEEHSHEFDVEENEVAFCIVDPDRGSSALYKVYELGSTTNPPSKTVVNSRVHLEYCKAIKKDRVVFQKSSRLREEMKAGGREFAEMANGTFLGVLRASAKDENIVQVNDSQLGNFLSHLYSELGKKKYLLDTIIFSEHLRQLLVVNDIVIPDDVIQNQSYIGRTKGGSKAFCSNQLPSGTAIAFDKKIGFALTGKEEFALRGASSPNIAEMCGYFPLNPIVKDRRGVVLIEGVEEAISGKSKSIMRPELPQTRVDTEYVDSERLDELRAIKSKDFDLRRLIKLCEELNSCWLNGSYLSTAMIVRAILDHVPPIFNQPNFLNVVSQYGDKSFKESVSNLQNSSRNISDRHLHTKIRRKETLPTKTQVNFSQDLDVLLEEIVHLLS